MRRALAAVMVSAALAVSGCAVIEGASKPLPRAQETTENKAAQAARRAIDESYAVLTALNRAIAENVREGVWTPDQGETYLAESISARKKVDEASDLLAAGKILDAKGQAEIMQRAILAIHRRVAAEARRSQ